MPRDKNKGLHGDLGHDEPKRSKCIMLFVVSCVSTVGFELLKGPTL
jgi:hypothetical protein